MPGELKFILLGTYLTVHKYTINIIFITLKISGRNQILTGLWTAVHDVHVRSALISHVKDDLMSIIIWRTSEII